MTERHRLPSRRQSYTTEFVHQGKRYVASASIYPFHDDLVWGEVFLNYPLGGEIADLARDAAVLVSIALQYGAPLLEIRKSLTRLEPRDQPGLTLSVIQEWPDAAGPVGTFIDLLSQWRDEWLAQTKSETS